MKWTCIILTCQNENNAFIYEKELKLRKSKGLLGDHDVFIKCVEDPLGQSIGSGGATLNAILHSCEFIQARNKNYKTCKNSELLKNDYVLIMHMGRSYPFDLVGRAFNTLPFKDTKTNNYLTNFDILFNCVTNNIAIHSDPGFYVCSTDMFLKISNDEIISIRNHQVCVLSCKVDRDDALRHGIYDYDQITNKVKNIHFQANDVNLIEIINHTHNDKYALVNGIVYLNNEIVELLYNQSLCTPLNACNYLGVDNEAEPIIVTYPLITSNVNFQLSLFFDILLPMCTNIDKDTYLNGRFNTNHKVPSNQQEILGSIRLCLWESLRDKFIIYLIQMSEQTEYIYLNNNTLEHRLNLFKNKQSTIIQSFISESNLIFNDNHNNNNNQKDLSPILLNCNLNSCNLDVGSKCFLNDLNWSFEHRSEHIKISKELFVQQVYVYIDEIATNDYHELLIVFGINDDLMKSFEAQDWTIFNKSWYEFNELTGIEVNHLWDTRDHKKTLLNAKLYPVLNLKHNLKEIFLNIDQFVNNNNNNSRQIIKEWSQSMRLSLNDIHKMANVDKLLLNRREIVNKLNVRTLIESIIQGNNEIKINFNAIIMNIIHEDYVNELLKSLDNCALKHTTNLIVLSRLMAFISNTLYLMTITATTTRTTTSTYFNLSSRSGPYLNPLWLKAYTLIEQENGVEEGLRELKRLRSNWMHRDDLLLRASRHYEGVMQVFIRRAVFTCEQFIQLERDNDDELRSDDAYDKWIEVSSPARLDLAGAYTDTPPICYESFVGSCVVNVSILINNQMPIGARCRILKHENHEQQACVHVTIRESRMNELNENSLHLKFDSLNEFKTFNRPQVIACLIKACLIYTKLVDLNTSMSLDEQLKAKLNGSLDIQIWTHLIPRGSGLGTSSILIGCVLLSLWKLMKLKPQNDKCIVYAVLLVEQLMTTNGGWQDQIGGLLPGFKYTTCKQGLPLELDYESIQIDKQFEHEINSRLILVYTGISRLAKDLLFSVLRNWYKLSECIYENVHDLVANGNRCLKSLKESNLIHLGECINRHRKNKLVMAPESEPDEVKQLCSVLEPFVCGMALAGAGGGGFLYILTKEKNQKLFVQELINRHSLNMTLYDACISNDGFKFKFY